MREKLLVVGEARSLALALGFVAFVATAPALGAELAPGAAASARGASADAPHAKKPAKKKPAPKAAAPADASADPAPADAAPAAPAPSDAATSAAATAAASAGSSDSGIIETKGGTARIDFSEAVIEGSGVKAGAIYLYERKESDLLSIVKLRTTYRDEMIRTVFSPSDTPVEPKKTPDKGLKDKDKTGPASAAPAGPDKPPAKSPPSKPGKPGK